jgi:hypothetical protein
MSMVDTATNARADVDTDCAEININVMMKRLLRTRCASSWRCWIQAPKKYGGRDKQSKSSFCGSKNRYNVASDKMYISNKKYDWKKPLVHTARIYSFSLQVGEWSGGGGDRKRSAPKCSKREQADNVFSHEAATAKLAHHMEYWGTLFFWTFVDGVGWVARTIFVPDFWPWERPTLKWPTVPVIVNALDCSFLLHDRY